MATLEARLAAQAAQLRWTRILALVALLVGAAGLAVAASTGRAGSATPDVVQAREVQVFGPGRVVRARLAVGDDGTPFLAFNREDGEVRVGLGVPSDGLPSLVLLDAKGQVQFMAP